MTNLLALAAVTPSLFGPASLPSPGSFEAYSRAFGPRNAMMVAKPTLQWEVWPSRGTVTQAQMTLNGQEVQPRYDARLRSLVYTPDKALAPGQYKVKCRVVINGSMNASKEWEFRVTSQSSSELPAPTPLQQRIYDAIHAYRAALDLPAFQMDDRLNAASLAHVTYLARHNVTGHYQKEGLSGFVGATPGERFEAFGFVKDSWEGVDYGAPAPEQGVRNLFDAPYHRLPFLQPGSPELGCGYDSERLAISFGTSEETATVVYPAPGQKDVPTTWDANERPHPLRIHKLSRRAVGYPITLARFGPEVDRISVEDATLHEADSGRSVPIYLNTPGNDGYLRNAAILMARTPLKPGTTYEVRVSGREVRLDGARGHSISRVWQFTTAAR